jgi:hypothetical protein
MTQKVRVKLICGFIYPVFDGAGYQGSYRTKAHSDISKIKTFLTEWGEFWAFSILSFLKLAGDSGRKNNKLQMKQ